MSGYGVSGNGVQVPRYYYFPGRNPRDCGWKPGLHTEPKQSTAGKVVKNTLTTTGFLTIAGLTIAAIAKPSLLKKAGSALVAEGKLFLTKHPNLSQGVQGFKNIAVDMAHKAGEYLLKVGTKV